jgi:outer membrane protein OmpA-like peptidoglycan-associated protein
VTPSLLWLASIAHAQQNGIPQELPIDAQRFRPPIDPYGYAVTESSATLENLQVGVGIWGDYAEDSVTLELGGQRVIGPGPDFPDALLNERSVFDFQLGLGLADRFALVAEVPVIVWQEGFDPATPQSPTPTADLVTSGLGDLRITPKVVAVHIDEGYPVGLAFLANTTIPTGGVRSFMGEGNVTVQPMAVFEVASDSVHDAKYLVRGAVNVGGRFKLPDRYRDVEFGSEFVYRVALSARPAPVFEIGGDLQGHVGGLRPAQVPTEILPWLRFHGFDIAAFTAGAGFGVNPGLGAADFRLFGALTLGPKFDPLSLDRDGDGIPNKFDACINIPEDHDGFEDDDGCPEDDNDKDGLKDPVDACPNDPEDFDNFEDQDGCPDWDNDKDGIQDPNDRCPNNPEDLDQWEDQDGCPDPDNDKDGIPDVSDACPNAPESVNGFQDQDGCPDEKPFVDTDGDGYEDERDRCPFEPEDFDRFQDEDGCPEPDNDGDGILDVVDQCPMEPETKNNYLDEDGCPDTGPSRVIVQKEKIVITEKVFFEYNKAIIQPISFELLTEVAGVINDHPRITRIQVEGHTDSDGSDTYNQKLSQARAQAVVDYLIGAGVDSARLVAKGFGESLPIDTNNTADGKAKNRRVEFTILEQDQ